jgi:hypothetical protein
MRMKSEYRALQGGGYWAIGKEERRKRSEGWSREIFISREICGGPVHAPYPIQES